MLLLVMHAEFENGSEPRIETRPGFQERRDRGIDMGTKRPHLGERWPRQQGAVRSRELLADGVVIGVEQSAELRMERQIAALSK